MRTLSFAFLLILGIVLLPHLISCSGSDVSLEDESDEQLKFFIATKEFSVPKICLGYSFYAAALVVSLVVAIVGSTIFFTSAMPLAGGLVLLIFAIFAGILLLFAYNLREPHNL